MDRMQEEMTKLSKLYAAMELVRDIAIDATIEGDHALTRRELLSMLEEIAVVSDGVLMEIHDAANQDN